MRPRTEIKVGRCGKYVYHRPNSYGVWAAMKSRCSNPKATSYRLYGGRGISVCQRWKSFDKFYEDMGDRPEGMSLERIDRDGNYEPSNCRWATEAEQHRNKSQNRWLTVGGRTQTLGDWATEMGLHKNTLQSRVAKGWPMDQLFRAVRRRAQTK